MRRVSGFGRRWWVLAGLCAGALVACVTPERQTEGEQTAPPTGGEALLLASARVALPPPMAAADLPDPESQGARLTAQFCGACHGIPAPGAHSATDWPVVLRRMWLRVGRLDTATYHIPVPDQAQRIVISEYLIANALQLTAGDLPDLPGRAAYVNTCGRCHGLPDVRQHAPADWVAVVRRMNTRMQTMLNEGLTQDQLQRIVGFLEAASGS